MCKKNDFKKATEILYNLSEKAAPRTRKEIREELRNAGVDYRSIENMKRDVEKLMTRQANQALWDRIRAILEHFRDELVSPLFLQQTPHYAVRSGEPEAGVEKTDRSRKMFNEARRLIRKGGYAEAKPILEELVEREDRTNISRYRYMLAQTLLGLKDVDAAVEQLKTIEGEFEERARTVLKEIESEL